MSQETPNKEHPWAAESPDKDSTPKNLLSPDKIAVAISGAPDGSDEHLTKAIEKKVKEYDPNAKKVDPKSEFSTTE